METYIANAEIIEENGSRRVEWRVEVGDAFEGVNSLVFDPVRPDGVHSDYQDGTLTITAPLEGLEDAPFLTLSAQFAGGRIIGAFWLRLPGDRTLRALLRKALRGFSGCRPVTFDHPVSTIPVNKGITLTGRVDGITMNPTLDVYASEHLKNPTITVKADTAGSSTGTFTVKCTTTRGGLGSVTVYGDTGDEVHAIVAVIDNI